MLRDIRECCGDRQASSEWGELLRPMGQDHDIVEEFEDVDVLAFFPPADSSLRAHHDAHRMCHRIHRVDEK